MSTVGQALYSALPSQNIPSAGEDKRRTNKHNACPQVTAAVGATEQVKGDGEAGVTTIGHSSSEP